MERYVRVHLGTAAGGWRKVNLRVTGETDSVLTGVEVDATGQDIRGEGVVRQEHRVPKATLTTCRPMVKNQQTGALELVNW